MLIEGRLGQGFGVNLSLRLGSGLGFGLILGLPQIKKYLRIEKNFIKV